MKNHILSVYGSSILEKYESDACQIGVEEAVTTGLFVQSQLFQNIEWAIKNLFDSVGIFWLETPVHYTFKRVDGKKQMLVRANHMYTDEENTSKVCPNWITF